MRIAPAIAALAVLFFATRARADGVYSRGGFNPFNLPGGGAIVPTASIGVLAPNPWASTRGSDASLHHELEVAMWAGFAVHPHVGVISPWTAFGSEFNTHTSSTGASSWEYVPEMRFGISGVMNDVRRNHAYVMIPFLEAYGIAGYRLANTRAGFERPGATRLGLGVSSPALMALVVYATGESGKCVPLPTMFESTVDLEPHGAQEVNLRMGWQF